MAAAEGRLVIDTIVGASAGSIGGVLLAHALLSGTGAEDLEGFWIREADLRPLLRGGAVAGRPRSPLSPKLLERWVAGRLARSDGTPLQEEPIGFVVSIANLRGLRYGIGPGIAADTYRDRQSFLLTTDTDWGAVLPAVAASAAHPFAFPPIRLRRRRGEYPPGTQFPGDQADLWYTDGGIAYTRPLGMAIDAVVRPENVGLPSRPLAPERRLFLLVDPHPSAPPPTWPPSGGIPSFRTSAVRALALSQAQSIYDDLRRLVEMNERVVARRTLQAELSTFLPAPWEPEDAAARGLREVAEPVVGVDPNASPHDLLDRLLDRVTGTAHRDVVDINVVSPDLDPSHKPPNQLLAGDPYMAFLGFALRSARESDFGLGYRHLRAWWGARGRAIAEIDVGIPPHPLEARPPLGDLSKKDIPLLRRWGLEIRLAWRYFWRLLRA